MKKFHRAIFILKAQVQVLRHFLFVIVEITDNTAFNFYLTRLLKFLLILVRRLDEISSLRLWILKSFEVGDKKGPSIQRLIKNNNF